MSLNDLVQMNISASTQTPSKPGFGTILIAAQKVPAGFLTRFRQFGSLTEMTDFGFSTSDPAYLCAQKCKAQDPAIERFIVGKRLNKVTQTVELKCTSAVKGDVYKITIGGTTVTRTVGNGSSTDAEAAAIAALIDAISGVSASAATSSNIVTVEADAEGELVNFKDWTDNIELTDVTQDAGGESGLAADLAAIKAACTLDWYGLALDSNSQEEIEVAALFTETEKKLFVPNNSDHGCGDAGTTTDVMSALKAAAYARTGVLWSKKELLSYSGAAWMAKQFAGAKPGEDTWAFKTLAGVTVDNLLDGERSAILAKNGNFYAPTSDVNITERGTSAAGEFLDVTRFVDWQKAEIQFRVFFALVNNKKIPYSDLGIDAIGAIIDGALGAGEEAGGLIPGTRQVTVPKRSTISGSTAATRKLSGAKFTAKLAGAIHELEIDGSLTP